MVQSIEEVRRRSAGRVPPHNLEAEESLLGAMLLSRDAITAAVEARVDATDFYKPAHGHVFEAVMALYGQGEPVDPVTVAEQLRRAELLYPDRVGIVDEPNQPAASWGSLTYREVAERARAIAAGVDYFDTAVLYGNGESETNLGRILQKLKPANAVVGTKATVKPDYERCVAISTEAALKEMLLPGGLAVVVPLVIGFISTDALGGFLAGALVSGFALAIFMANAGGAWDNAKKYIEAGAHGGKGSDPHKAAVVGDTVGDPFKDTSGPSLNILIKLMSVVSLVLAPWFAEIHAVDIETAGLVGGVRHVLGLLFGRAGPRTRGARARDDHFHAA